MPKIIKPLTRKEILAKPSTTATNQNPDKRNDGNGLTLLVFPSGTRSWRCRYKFNGSRKDWVFADYAMVDEIQARKLNTHYQQLASQGIDPRKASYADSHAKELTFKVVAEEMLAERTKENMKDGENIRRLNKHIYPAIGNMPHAQISKQIMQDMILDPIIERGTFAEAKKTKSVLKLVFDYAIDKYEMLDANPADKLRHPKYKPKPFDAIIDEQPLKQFLKDVWNYRATHPRANIHTANLLKLSILIYLRPSEIRTLKWSQYNKQEQTIYAYASKVDVEHPVLLPRQAVTIMEELEQHARPNNDYIFPTHFSGKNQPLSEAAVRTALHKLGYKDIQTAHGLRATARTILDEELEMSVMHLESQLTHRNEDANKGSYNRSRYKRQRGRILQKWADYLDALRNDEDVERFKPNDDTPEQQLERLLDSVGDDKAFLEQLIRKLNKDDWLALMK